LTVAGAPHSAGLQSSERFGKLGQLGGDFARNLGAAAGAVPVEGRAIQEQGIDGFALCGEPI
jgi:hypothetical protein